MGIISLKLCSYENNEKELEPENKNHPKLITTKSNTTEQSENDSQCSHEVKTKVKFSNVVYQRFYFNENENLNEQWHDEHKFSPVQLQEDITVISFEEDSQHRFIIEDGFFKIKYKMAKTNNDETIFKSVPEISDDKKIIINEVIKSIMAYCLDNKINRIDGLSYNNINSTIVLMTEFFLLEFKIEGDNFTLNRSIKIASIDYITLSSNGEKMILHLMVCNRENIEYQNDNPAQCESSTNHNHLDLENPEKRHLNNRNEVENALDDNTKINSIITNNRVKTVFELNSLNSENYYLEDNFLEKVVSCLASSYFLKFTYDSRFLYVIIINPNFEIYDLLYKIKDFSVYKETLNNFLTKKLKEMNDLKIDLNNFKYSGVKYKIKGEKQYNLGDFIITFDKFVLLNYKNLRFELVKEFNPSEIETIIPNKKSKSFSIITKKEIVKIKTVSYSSIAFLLEKIYKRLIDRP